MFEELLVTKNCEKRRKKKEMLIQDLAQELKSDRIKRELLTYITDISRCSLKRFGVDGH